MSSMQFRKLFGKDVFNLFTIRLFQISYVSPVKASCVRVCFDELWGFPCQREESVSLILSKLCFLLKLSHQGWPLTLHPCPPACTPLSTRLRDRLSGRTFRNAPMPRSDWPGMLPVKPVELQEDQMKENLRDGIKIRLTDVSEKKWGNLQIHLSQWCVMPFHIQDMMRNLYSSDSLLFFTN